MITIVNYGSGNIQAITNIYKKLNIEHIIAETPEQLNNATKLILPGVGAFDKTMSQLVNSGLKNKLDHLVLEKKIPVMGICVGMQIMAQKSDEGILDGLGWIEGEVKKIDTTLFTHKPHVPHMGWNTIQPTVTHKLFTGVNLDVGFYFLHTYYFSCQDEKNTLSTTFYGKSFSSSINNDNIFGMQFHPEKSHNNGIQLLKNFANL